MSRRLPSVPDESLTYDGMGGQFFCPSLGVASAALLQLPKELWPRLDPAEIHFLERLWFGDNLMDVLELMLTRKVVKATPVTDVLLLRIGGSTFRCNVASPVQNARAGLRAGIFVPASSRAVHVDSLPEQMQQTLLPLLVVMARVQRALRYFEWLQVLAIPAAVAARWLHPALKNGKSQPIAPAQGVAGERWVRWLMARERFDPGEAVRHGGILRASLLLYEMGQDRKGWTAELHGMRFRVQSAEVQDLAPIEALASARGVL